MFKAIIEHRAVRHAIDKPYDLHDDDEHVDRQKYL
jgi:hypothetical protein